MNNKEIIIDNEISGEEFCKIRESVGFQKLSMNQANKILEHTTYISVARYNGKCIGITRLLFDYCTDAYITDVIVDPVFQGMGIGKTLVESVLNFIKDNVEETHVVVSLYANRGKETFYEKFGFTKLPSEKYGYGMVLDL